MGNLLYRRERGMAGREHIEERLIINSHIDAGNSREDLEY